MLLHNKVKKRTYYGKKLLLAAVTGFMIAQPMLFPPSVKAAEAVAPTTTLVNETPVTSGATLQKYIWKSTRQGKAVTVNGQVIKVDLNDPYVKLDVMMGTDGRYTTRQTVLGMAKATGAVAGVNGDYYSTTEYGAPLGPQISNQVLMTSPSYLAGMYTFALTQDNKPLIDTFNFSGRIVTDDVMFYPLSGINKTFSYGESMYLYTDAWGSSDRGELGDRKPTEMLVRNGTIVKIAADSVINMAPPADGFILRAGGKAAEFITTNLQEGQKLYAEYELIPTDPQKSYDTNNFKMLIGGHTILVDEGKPAAFSRNVDNLSGNRSRTGVGYSQNGRYVYIVTVDHSGTSQGMNLKEFQQFMVSVGVWKGMNLDGGGSTQLVSRPLGDLQPKLSNDTEYGTERKIVNGLGVYTTAPQGEVKGVILQGNQILFLREEATFRLKAYDVYYNPVDTTKIETQWQSSNPLIGTFQGSVFVPEQVGETTVTTSFGQAQHSLAVEVIGKKQIAGMKITAPDAVLSSGDSYKLPVTVTTKKDQKRTVPAELINWEFIGFDGAVDGDTLTVNKLSDSGVGNIIARYDGFSTMLTLPAGVGKMWTDFNDLSFPVTFEATPNETRGNARIVTGLTNMDNEDSPLLYMTYDFSEGTGTKAIYAAFGDNVTAVQGEPYQMKMEVMGDNSLNWLRAEVVDAKGALHRVDIHKNINWYGWKELTVNLADYKMDYPIKLNKIYLANPKEGQDEREAYGVVAIDDISFVYKGKLPELVNKKVELAVGRKSISVDDQQMKLDQAPVVIGGHTLIPVRFFIDAMGGEIAWDPAEKKVTIMRGEHLVELWIDDAEMIVDGQSVMSPITPRLLGGRTVLPLRLISEKLGWKVDWEEKTKSITLE